MLREGYRGTDRCDVCEGRFLKLMKNNDRFQLPWAVGIEAPETRSLIIGQCNGREKRKPAKNSKTCCIGTHGFGVCVCVCFFVYVLSFSFVDPFSTGGWECKYISTWREDPSLDVGSTCVYRCRVSALLLFLSFVEELGQV